MKRAQIIPTEISSKLEFLFCYFGGISTGYSQLLFISET